MRPRRPSAPPFAPRSPYACANAYAFWQTVNHRETYGLLPCNGVLFNHESPRPGETFVTRKITRPATPIAVGLQHALYLGNLDTKRDCGFAADYVHAMRLTLQQDQPEDYVIATGDVHSVREFAEVLLHFLGLDAYKYIRRDDRYLRSIHVEALCGDSSKARRVLHWTPTVSFLHRARMMTDANLELAPQERLLADQKSDGAPSVALLRA